MTLTTDRSQCPTRRGGVKNALVRCLLGCLGGTAALAMYAVLTGSFHRTGVQVLLSTLLVAASCVLCLACLTALETPHRAVGLGGTLASCGALACGLRLVWADHDEGWQGGLWILRAFGICSVLAFAAAHCALLLRLTAGELGGLRVAVLAIVALVAAMLCAAFLSVDLAQSEGYWRGLGTLAILDVLGTVCLPVLARLGGLRAR